METASKDMNETNSLFVLYGREVRKYPLLLFVIVIGILATQGIGIVLPLYIREIINILGERDTSATTVSNILWIIFVFAVLSLVRWFADRVRVRAMAILEGRAMASLYPVTFEYLIQHSYQFFTSQFTGSLTQKVNKYVGAFVDLFDTVIDRFITTALYVGGATIILFIHNHVLGIMLGVWSILFVIIQVFLSRLHRPMRLARAEAHTKMVGNMSDVIGNHNAVSLFSAVAYERNRFQHLIEVWDTARLKAWRFMEYMFGIQNLLMIVINVMLLYGAVHYWQRGELTVGDFVLIQTYLLGSFGMLTGITSTLRGFYDSLADAHEMSVILNLPHDVIDVKEAQPILVQGGDIQFENVKYFFNESQPLLENLNLHIHGGEKIALVGLSGAGKSTVTKLLLRLFDVKSGTITIDGQDISKVTQESLRNAIAFVPQEPVLFHRSLMENIRYGKRDASDEEVIEAARKAHCHEFISALPEGYETFVGERGVKLSGGERQRVAVARAILKNAPILVLDEATSSLDSESEALIQDALEVLMKGKTVLAIAHRLSTIMKMDRILVMENGKIVDDGTHATLLQNDGLYQKLWNIQAGGFLQDDEE